MTELETRLPVPEGAQLPTLPGQTFADLVSDGLNGQTDTRELIKVKEDLLGTMMILTSFTFRPGIAAEKGGDGDYVSVEAVTVENRRVVFNDSSTGVRRQVVNWLISQGVIANLDPDTPFQQWDPKTTKGEYRGAAETRHLRIETIPTGEPIRFLARHGLRVSRYPNPAGKGESETYYLD